MRFLLAAGVGPFAATMLLGGCTLDYDLFQVGEGGGGSAPTTTSTTGTDVGSSASTTAVGSTASSTSGGGEGGATTTSASVGTGGEGGVGPILPCEGLALSFEPSSIDEALEGSAWEADETGDGRLDTDFDRLVIDVDGNGSDQAETAEIRTREADLFACSVAVELRQFDASPMDFPATAYLSAVGDWGGEGDEYEGLEVFVSPREACEIGSRLRGDADWDGDTATCELPTPSVFLRLTHTGEELCHEVSEDGVTFQTLHCRPATTAYRVALGATTVENVMFYFGRIN